MMITCEIYNRTNKDNMPTYAFRHRETGEITETFMKMVEKDQYLIDHPELESIINFTNPLCDPVTIGVRRPDTGFREVLQRIKDANPGSGDKSGLRIR
jgi:hypothetical protein